MTEIWKEIKGFEGLYECSNLGRIARLTKAGNFKILKQYTDNSSGGYNKVNLCKNGKVHLLRVARIIAETFIPNPDNKPQVDHINTNRTDNRVENLRWVTHKENMNNSTTTLNNIKAQRKVMKPVVQMTSDGHFKQIYRSQAYAGKFNNKSSHTIYAYCNKKYNDTSGDRWELLENIDFKEICLLLVDVLSYHYGYHRYNFETK